MIRTRNRFIVTLYAVSVDYTVVVFGSNSWMEWRRRQATWNCRQILQESEWVSWLCVKSLTSPGQYCLGDHHQRSLLETENGRQFSPIFKAVRLQHIMNDVVSVRTLEADGIIPPSKTSHAILWPMGVRVSCRSANQEESTNLHEFSEY